jgi:protein-L-isoaspartate(D-aspartate) O-methyltransferase
VPAPTTTPPLPIGGDQTISQAVHGRPHLRGALGSTLRPRPDVGTGSGYQAPVLAALAYEVHTIERLPELADRAREALAAAGCKNVEVHVGDGSLGLPEHAPFGAIAVAAAAPEVPRSLYAQLEPGGRLAVPVGGRHGQELQLVVRSPEGPAVVRTVPCRFVPLVGAEGFDGE